MSVSGSQGTSASFDVSMHSERNDAGSYTAPRGGRSHALRLYLSTEKTGSEPAPKREAHSRTLARLIDLRLRESPTVRRADVHVPIAATLVTHIARSSASALMTSRAGSELEREESFGTRVSQHGTH
jgi:hypothetical protein